MQLLTNKVRVGNYLIEGRIYEDKDQLIFRTSYNKVLIEDIKMFQGARWNPTEKFWTAPVNERNMFALQFMLNKNPAAHFVETIKKLPELRTKFTPKRELRANQIDLVLVALQNKVAIWAAEPGLGKSLAFITVAEELNYLTPSDVWYVGPKAGVVAVTRELAKWGSKCNPRMLTYEGFTKLMMNWPGGSAPKMVCFDESQKIKSPSAQRTKAALQCARAVRSEWDGYVILMTGTPAPKSPSDWWQQCEIARPGFLREPDLHKFNRRYALIVQEESQAGSSFPRLVTWWDNPDKCATCGKLKSEHSETFIENTHTFISSKDEVGALTNRLKGLVVVQFKKDYSDLPDKMYEVIRLKPSLDTIRTLKIINSVETSPVTKLIKLRELSDGFQYVKGVTGSKTCEECSGAKQFMQATLKEGVGLKDMFDASDYEHVLAPCPVCKGRGEVDTYTRTVMETNSPKLEYFINDLEAYEDIGRYIVWGGFTETVDLLTKTALEQDWHVLQIDGRGYHGFAPGGSKVSSDELLDAMDRSHPQSGVLTAKYPRVVVVGHPKAGGVALTLTSSPVSLYYSNPFDGEARMQSEDRGHRIGMDANRGFLIKDLVHLPTDQLILDNLKKKKTLQSITMGDIESSLRSLS